MCEPGLLLREGNCIQKIAELLQHVFFTKFFQPYAQVSLIRHAAIIPEWEKADGKSHKSKKEISGRRCYFFFGGNSSSGSGLKSVESPSSRAFNVSPIVPSTSEQVSRKRFSAALAIVSSTACECCPKVVAEASSQEFEAFSNRVL